MLFQTMIVLQHTIFFGSVVNGGVTLPLVVDGEGEAEKVSLDVLLYLWIERILLGVGVTGHEGLDLNVELANTVGSGYVKGLWLGMIGDDFGIVRQFLLAGDCEEYAQNKGNKGKSAEGDKAVGFRKYPPPPPWISVYLRAS